MKISAFFLAFIISFSINLSSYGIEEVILDVNDEIYDSSNSYRDEKNKSCKEKTLQEKIVDIKAREINDTNKTTYLLEEILTVKPKNSILDSAHFFGYYRSDLNVNIDSDNTSTGYNYTEITAGVNGKFKDGKTFYEARLRFTPQSDYSFIQYMPANLYIANTSIPHHTVIVGNTRTPVGHEGALSVTLLPFIMRSQIARNFGNTRKVGVRIKGKYDYIDYDIGGYSSESYFKKFFPGAEFSGWATVKPFGKRTKFGELKLGGGITAGQNGTDYFVSGAYLGYEYKNFTADFEWAKADGYNGAIEISTNKAEGFYSTIGYKITPKLQAVARYDQYTPNLNYPNDIRREYSAGFNYFIKGQALKLMLNYVFCQRDLFEDSHRLMLGTQILL